MYPCPHILELVNMHLNNTFMKSRIFVSVILMLLVLTSCRKDNIIPIVGLVVEKSTQSPIQGAVVTYNATETYVSNAQGKIFTEYNLGRYIADSISLYVSAPGYKEKQQSFLIGNVQKDLIKIELEFE